MFWGIIYIINVYETCRCNYDKKAEAKYGLSFRNIAHIDIGYICIILFIYLFLFSISFALLVCDRNSMS